MGRGQGIGWLVMVGYDHVDTKIACQLDDLVVRAAAVYGDHEGNVLTM